MAAIAPITMYTQYGILESFFCIFSASFLVSIKLCACANEPQMIFHIFLQNLYTVITTSPPARSLERKVFQADLQLGLTRTPPDTAP